MWPFMWQLLHLASLKRHALVRYLVELHLQHFCVTLFIALTFSVLISVEMIYFSRSAFSIVFANSMGDFKVNFLSANCLHRMLLFCQLQTKRSLKVWSKESLKWQFNVNFLSSARYLVMVSRFTVFPAGDSGAFSHPWRHLLQNIVPLFQYIL